MNYEFLGKLISMPSVGGTERGILNLIKDEIGGSAETHFDGAGNLIAYKKGEKSPAHRLLIDAHADEIGFIITGILPDGCLKFAAVGGIAKGVMPGKRVRVNGIPGVIGMKPVHLCKSDERKEYPAPDSLYIDIGASDKSQAEALVKPGDTAVFDETMFVSDSAIAARALDDKAGCAILVSMLKKPAEYDFYASFSVGEEVGMRGARCAAYGVNPDYCIVLETTTAADINGVKPENRVCGLGLGPVISFMDRATVYDRGLYGYAISCGVNCQIKKAVAGGNNSGSVSLSRSGVRTVAVSVAGRYLHSPLCAVSTDDLELCEAMAEKVKDGILSGKI